MNFYIRQFNNDEKMMMMMMTNDIDDGSGKTDVDGIRRWWTEGMRMRFIDQHSRVIIDSTAVKLE